MCIHVNWNCAVVEQDSKLTPFPVLLRPSFSSGLKFTSYRGDLLLGKCHTVPSQSYIFLCLLAAFCRVTIGFLFCRIDLVFVVVRHVFALSATRPFSSCLVLACQIFIVEGSLILDVCITQFPPCQTFLSTPSILECPFCQTFLSFL